MTNILSQTHTDAISKCVCVLKTFREDESTIQRRVFCWKQMFCWLKAVNKPLISQENIEYYLKAESGGATLGYFALDSINILKSILFSDFSKNKELQAILNVPLEKNSDFYKHLQWLKSSKNLSSITLANRQRVLNKFQQYLTVFNIDYESINPETINKFYKVIHASRTTRHNNNNMLSVLFKWLFSEKIVSKDLRVFIKNVPYKKKSIQAPLSIKELEKLWKYIETDCSNSGLRNKAIIAILLSTGLRRMDVANIKISDIEWSNKNALLRVRVSKNKQQAIFKLPTAVGNAIYRYMHLARPNHDSEILFQTSNGTPLSPELVSSVVSTLLRKLGLWCAHCNNGAHRIRGSIATISANQGTPEYVISSLLSHQSSLSLRSYVSFNVKELKKCSLETEPVTGGFYYELNKLKKEDNND